MGVNSLNLNISKTISKIGKLKVLSAFQLDIIDEYSKTGPENASG